MGSLNTYSHKGLWGITMESNLADYFASKSESNWNEWLAKNNLSKLKSVFENTCRYNQ